MKNYLFLIALVMSVLTFTSCDKNKGKGLDPETLAGNVEKPTWVADTVSYDYSSSMTAVIKVDLLASYPVMAKDFQLNDNDLLSAFSGETCVGVAKCVNGLFYLFVAGKEGPVTLRFYSGYYKNLFEAKDAFTFQNDAILGTYTEPFKPTFLVVK